MTAHGWNGNRLAAKAGRATSTISGYLTGDVTLTRERLEWLVGRMGLGLADVEKGIASARLVYPEPPPAASPVDPTPEEWAIIDQAVAFGLGEMADLLRAQCLREIREAHFLRQRKEAEVLVERLKRHTRAERRALGEFAPEFQTWAVCVRLCDESEKTAPHSPRQALAWAVLACRVAVQVPEEEGFRACLLAFAQAFVANALRAKGRLRKADKVFIAVQMNWAKGNNTAGLLDEGRLLDLQASLRRDQRRFKEALELHGSALRVAQPDQLGLIYLNLATTLKDKGDYAKALAVLEASKPLVHGLRRPRLAYGLRFTLVFILCRTGRAGDALTLLTEVKELAEQLQNDLDLIRTLWLESQVLKELGRRPEAIETLQQVRRDFAARSMPFQFALASIDLAQIYREQSRWPEVTALAEEMLRNFMAEGVVPEILAAMALLKEAAGRCQVTASLLISLQRYLSKAERNPKLRFTAGYENGGARNGAPEGEFL